MFKDISTTSRALRLSKIDALFWMVQNNKKSADFLGSDYYYINQIIADQREDIIDFLTSNLFCGLECMTYRIQPHIILYAASMAKQSMVSMLLTPTNEWYQKPIGLDVKFKTTSMAINLIRIMYQTELQLPSVSY